MPGQVTPVRAGPLLQTPDIVIQTADLHRFAPSTGSL